jgi:hypothetical protein
MMTTRSFSVPESDSSLVSDATQISDEGHGRLQGMDDSFRRTDDVHNVKPDQLGSPTWTWSAEASAGSPGSRVSGTLAGEK